MPRYIDADKLIRDLIDNRSFYPAIVKSAIENAPTEDVVPRSECVKWYAEYHKVKEDLKQEIMYHRATEKLADKYLVELKQAEQDVVIKVIDEFQKMLKCETHYETSITGHRYPVVDIDKIDFIAEELKKKYIGE